MQSLGMKADIKCKASAVDLATYLTTAQFRELYAAGFNIMCHNYTSGVGLGDLTEAQQETEIANMRDFIQNTLLCPGGDIIWGIHGAGSIYWDYNLQTSFPAQGIVMNEGGPGTSLEQWSPPGNLLNMHNKNPYLYDLATNEARIDDLIACGRNEIWGWERLDQDTDTSTANYELLMDYIYTKWKAGLLYPITMLQYYQAQLGPILVAK
jgi:hypothetical protein